MNPKIDYVRFKLSATNFVASLPSSFLVAKFGNCIFTPAMCFFNIIFLPSVKIIFIVYGPDFWTCRMIGSIGRQYGIKTFITVAWRNNFVKSKEWRVAKIFLLTIALCRTNNSKDNCWQYQFFHRLFESNICQAKMREEMTSFPQILNQELNKEN